jgi:transposase
MSEEERQELQQMAQSRSLPAGDVMRARMMLLLSEGVPYRKIPEVLNTTAPTISRWKERFRLHGVAGLMEERHPGQKPSVRTPKLQARILAAIKNGPNDGSTHWSCRKLASRFGISKDTVQRILTQADVRPHRLERYMASDDPDFESKAADVIGLYMAPPQHTAVFCMDEKTAIQALDRLDPVLSSITGPTGAARFRIPPQWHSVLVCGAGCEDWQGAEQDSRAAYQCRFIDFLEQLVATCKTRQEIHIILDNLSAHKTAKVTAFLERNPNVKLHFRPTYSSWLNQVEIWFSRLERQVIARGIFTSVNDLARKLMRYIRAYSKTARPFKWKYSDVRRRILPC